jgi:predicted RNase H-like HicB family nuclease
MRRYSVVLMPDDGGYPVLVLALPGCVTQGDSVPGALERARDAIRVYLEDATAHDEKIPEKMAPPCSACSTCNARDATDAR